MLYFLHQIMSRNAFMRSYNYKENFSAEPHCRKEMPKICNHSLSSKDNSLENSLLTGLRQTTFTYDALTFSYDYPSNPWQVSDGWKIVWVQQPSNQKKGQVYRLGLKKEIHLSTGKIVSIVLSTGPNYPLAPETQIKFSAWGLSADEVHKVVYAALRRFHHSTEADLNDVVRLMRAEYAADIPLEPKEVKPWVQVGRCKVRHMEGTLYWHSVRQRQTNQTTLYDKAKKENLSQPLTRLEHTYLIPTKQRPTLNEFIDGTWVPLHPFYDLLIIDAAKMEREKEIKRQRDAWRSQENKRRFEINYQMLRQFGVAASWKKISPEWRKILRENCLLVSGQDTMENRFKAWHDRWTVPSRDMQIASSY
jgi:hypothetical protein